MPNLQPPASPIVGIDLGTTNSVVAALRNGRVEVLEEEGEQLLPSVVGITTDGQLLVGQLAKNQLIAFPDRTVASVKRRMGEAIQLQMAGQDYSPQEISAMVLRRLRDRAEKALGVPVTRAVITVPAFFDENQRQATREAGVLAGLTVERIINEPTAASLVYCADSPARRHLIVYDLGGGTFDVSIVRVEAGVVEVLSSRGDTHLGGDDFDELLTKHVAERFLGEHDVDLMDQPGTRWRLMQACERAKCELSFSSSVRVAEEFIATLNGAPLHLDLEISRSEYEELIKPLVERTISCVDDAIRDSKLSVGQLDELILVGGSTRTPLVQHRLREEFHRDPKWAVNPDLAVALGAATQAAMQEGTSVGPVLIDVATHTLGIEALHGRFYDAELLFSPILRRNSPLPARYEEDYWTMSPDQTEAEIVVYQGESAELSNNRKLGHFRLLGLNQAKDPDGRIQVRFELTLDGILKVTAIEHRTGRSESLTIDNALSRMRAEHRAEKESRLQSLFEAFQGSDSEIDEATETALHDDANSAQTAMPHDKPSGDAINHDAPSKTSRLEELVKKARELQPTLNHDDAADVDRLVESINDAETRQDQSLLADLERELDDLLYYVSE
jgi:molecular chaperone DnaK